MSELIEKADDWLRDVLRDLDGPVLLASPFLSYDVCHRIAAAASDSAYIFSLVTTLDPGAVASGYQSVQGLAKLLSSRVHVQHVQRLHAKCFVLGSRAMLGSANLTGAGLGSSAAANRELGVELHAQQVADAVQAIQAWPARTVTSSDLDELVARSKELTRPSRNEAKAFDADIALSQAGRLLTDARDPGRGLWLKLEYGDPWLEGWRQSSYFASPRKGKPGFRPGDLVVICAKETKDCYAILEVTTNPLLKPDDYLSWSAENHPEAADRWPWVNRTKPRLLPSRLMQLKLSELGVKSEPLQNGHVRLKFDQFTAAVRALARLATD